MTDIWTSFLQKSYFSLDAKAFEVEYPLFNALFRKYRIKVLGGYADIDKRNSKNTKVHVWSKEYNRDLEKELLDDGLGCFAYFKDGLSHWELYPEGFKYD